jgi:hypothetical protein
MDDDSLECYRSALDAKLKRAELSIIASDFDPIAISRSVHVGITEINPATGTISLGVDSLIKNGKQHPDECD